MFNYLSIDKLLHRERAKNEKLREESRKLAADVDYIAMMCDVELEGEEDGNEQEV